MKKLNPIILLTLVILSALMAKSQSDDMKRGYISSQMANPTDPLDDIHKFATSYFNSLTPKTEVEADEELEEHYTRWYLNWKDRSSFVGVRSGGDILATEKLMLTNFATNATSCNNSTLNSQPWIAEGPSSLVQCEIGILGTAVIDPVNSNILYAGSDGGGLFKSNDGGQNWTNITDVNISGSGRVFNLGIGDMLIDPTNTNKLIVATNASVDGPGFNIGVIISGDGGQTWSTSSFGSLPSSGLIAKALTFGATTNIIFAGVSNSTGSFIYKSTDGGLNFTACTVNTPLYYPDAIPNTSSPNSYQYYDCSSGQVAPGGARLQVIDFEVFGATGNTVYASTNFSGGNGSSKLLVSTDGGATFNLAVLNPIYNQALDKISIDQTPADPGALFAFYKANPNPNFCSTLGASGVLAKTYDGVNWTILDAPPFDQFEAFMDDFGPSYANFIMSDLNATDYYIPATLLWRATWNGGGGYYTYSDLTSYFPNTFNGQPPNFTNTPSNTHADIRGLRSRLVGGNEELIVACDGGFIKSPDGGATWTCLNGNGLNCTKFFAVASFQKSNNLVGAPQDTWLKVKNNGAWTDAPLGSSTDGEAYFVQADYTNDKIVYATGNNGTISKSVDGGLTFNSLPPCPGGYSGVGKLLVDPTNHNLVWSCVDYTNTSLYFYDNTNSTWTMTHTPVPGTFSDPTSTPPANITPPIFPLSAVAIAPTNSNVIYEAREKPTYAHYDGQKLYRSINHGQTWTDITTNLTQTTFWAGITHIVIDPFNENRVFISFGDYIGTGNVGNNRVMMSVDGGNSFTDMSTGLTPFPVHYLAYQNGTDDVIYAATDVGIYRWNKAAATWECFNNGFPNVRATSIEINYCQNKLYAATWARGMYSCGLPAVPDFHFSTAWVNTTNASVNGAASNTFNIPAFYNQSFGNRLIVDAGVYLNIKGTMNFAINTPFVISKQSHVVVTGTLSTNCNQTWLGVHLGGDNSNNQNYSGGFAVNQGIIEVLNGGTIENAHYAITTATFDAAGNIDWGSMGGVISCANANFINNTKDIQFLSYPFTNKSKFINCTFETKLPILPSMPLVGHVSMWNVNNVTFLGNDFKYSALTNYPTNGRGYGIYSIDAGYTVKDYCTSNTSPCSSYKRGTFSDLTSGVVVDNISPTQVVQVSNCDFKRNYQYHGLFSNANYFTFVGNTIDAGLPTSVGFPSGVGVYVNNSKYYAIDNNTITATSNTSGNYPVGIYANNSGAGAHRIYRNNISNMAIGVSPENDNSGDNNYLDGLKIKCNTFNSGVTNQYDIAMDGSGPPAGNVSVDYFQSINNGQIVSPVGNKYGANCGAENMWYLGNLYNVKGAVHYNTNDAFAKITPQPGCSDAMIVPYNLSLSYSDAQCPNNYVTTPNPSGFNPNIGSGRSALTTATNNYNHLIDGGSTTNLLAIVNGTGSDASIKSSLSSASPYLSDDVLNAYFGKPTTPETDIVAIHSQNSPVNPAVWQVLVDRNLSTATMNSLNTQQSASKISDRNTAQSQVSDATVVLEQAYIDKLSYYFSDTLAGSLDTAINTLIASNLPDALHQTLAALVARPNTTITASIIDDMHGGAANVDDLCNFQKIMLQLNQTPQKLYGLITDATLKGQVVDIAADDANKAQSLARSALQGVFGTPYSLLCLYPGTSPGSRLASTSGQTDSSVIQIKLDGNQSMQLYPNPTAGVINVLLKGISTVDKTYQLLVRNNLGELVHQVALAWQSGINEQATNINLGYLPNGLYVLSILHNNNLIGENKLVIMK